MAHGDPTKSNRRFTALNTTPLTTIPAPSEDARVHLLGLDQSALRAWLHARGLPRYASDQIVDWIYEKSAPDFDAMSNLSRAHREALSADAAIFTARTAVESVAGDGTRKLLLEFPDRGAIETVWIPADGRNTACLSSQVGCPVGCRFCASGIDGVERNLTAGEIVEQALRVRHLIEQTFAERNRQPAPRSNRERRPESSLSNIVMMGMGEPLANYDNMIRAIRIINAPWGLNIGARRITISTVGLPKQIRRLAEEDLQLNLAFSLHATDDALRAELVPWARGVKLEDLLDACAYYFKQTGREVTLEYVLLDDVNMRQADALRLAKIAKRLRANVNLLRYNPVEGLPYRRPSSEAAFAFQDAVRRHGGNAHIRASRGTDVDAACGQLRRNRDQAKAGSETP